MKTGQFNQLETLRITDIGAYLDDGASGILLPKRFMPPELKVGDLVDVFVYHDSENRLIATTQQPYGSVGDIVKLRVVSTTPFGAFLDMGLMKDIFIPKKNMRSTMREKGEYLVYIYLDEKTGRLTASEKFDHLLQNDELTVNEKDAVDLIIYRRTNIGYVVIINNVHTGVLHFSDIFRSVTEGDKLKGFIKRILPENKIDVVTSQEGYERIIGEAGKLLDALHDANGYLPFNDKSDPEEIYANFGMSKKAFKMAIGTLYKQRKISLEKTGIKLIDP